MGFPRVRAVTLDAAGTLIAVAEPVGVTYARVAGRHGIDVAPTRIAAAFAQALRSAPPLAFPGAVGPALARLERAWWRGIVGAALGVDAGVRSLDGCFDELFAHYATPAAWRVLPGVPHALDRLRAGGLGLAVVSNFDGRLPALLRGLDLAARLDTIVHSSAAGHAKPDPGIFRTALRCLHVAAAEALHVGDDEAADVAGARAAGLDVLLVRPGGTAPPGVPWVRGVAEVPDRLGQP